MKKLNGTWFYLEEAQINALAEAAKKAGYPNVIGIVDGLRKSLASRRLLQSYVDEAKELYNKDGECEIDNTAAVSDSDEGAYVMAWVWVANTEDEEEDNDPTD